VADPTGGLRERLREELGDTRLVAEHLGHADLSPRCAAMPHVAREEWFTAVGRLERSR